jgi:hypothetical protein
VLPSLFLADEALVNTPARAPSHPRAGLVAGTLLSPTVAGADVGSEGRAAVFLEAPPRLALATAHLARRRDWWVVLLIAPWPIPRAVLPVEPLLGWVRRPPEPPRLPSNVVGNALFLLDASRHRAASQGTLRRRFDNRYEYLAHMLPPAAHLQRQGIQQARWISRTAAITDDLAGYADSLVAAGISLSLTPLTRLTPLR